MHFPSFFSYPPLYLLALLACFCGAPATRATIRYEVSLEHPERHLFHVTMTIPDVSGALTVQLPAWDTLYQIRDFSAHLQQVRAAVGTEKVPIEKLDKQTWRVIGTGQITIRYEAFWDDVGPFATQLNSEHAFLNPAMILMYVPERRGEAAQLCLRDLPARWQVAVESNGGPGSAQPGCSDAANYDEMADAPVETGTFEEFTVPGIKPEIRVVIHGDNWKRSRVENELKRICEYELKLMGGAPFAHYTFILHIGKAAAGAGGGMEHANSTAISVPSDEYLDGVAAHEFFHLWNVKRIRPVTLQPIDRTKEQYTRALWFAEGVTDTYGSYTQLRAGLWNKQEFYQDLSRQISELEGRPANAWQSAEQSSLDTWLEKYALYNRPEESVSYYTKGQILGVLLDILIRERTGNEKGLDDVMRLMNTEFALAGKTYRDSLDVRLSAEKVAGGSLEDFFTRYVAGADALPYQEVLGLAGLELRTIEHRRGVLGFFAERDANGTALVRNVDENGNAARSGLQMGDTIISWNGGEVPRHMDRWVNEQKPGSLLRLRVRRDGTEMSIDVPLGEMRDVRYEVAEASGASARAKKIRDGLLHGTTSRAAVQ